VEADSDLIIPSHLPGRKNNLSLRQAGGNAVAPGQYRQWTQTVQLRHTSFHSLTSCLQSLVPKVLEIPPVLIQKSARLSNSTVRTSVEQTISQSQKSLALRFQHPGNSEFQTLRLFVQTQTKIGQPGPRVSQSPLPADQPFAGEIQQLMNAALQPSMQIN
jgi:hypothetical protein